MVDDHRLVTVREMTIGQPVHQSVRQRIQFLSGPALRNTCPPGARLAEGRDAERGRTGQRRIRRRQEIYVDLPDVERIRAEVDEVLGRASGRRDVAVYVC